MLREAQNEEKVIISAYVDAVARDELLRRAEAGYRSLSAEIRRAINEHLGRDDEEDDR